ncbi:HTH-type transcriptional regulator [Rhynchospora pubera]|uniref:HTH-type transcriptional regulator n=1 Tax=Rhynchospora pubera TaxID=906938 RepID=A0AAV8H1A6_9POAL|nr:HTH-type transcriptional regulator [Rhynchospora pubera]
MGSCYSAYSDEMADVLPTAKVITIDGSLREYSVPTKVTEVLDEKHAATFLCLLDELYLDRGIPALESHDWVELNQIYFILPRSMLDQPLKGQDMAALAIKASLALAGALEKSYGKAGSKRDIQVMPLHELDDQTFDQAYTISGDFRNNEKTKRRALSQKSRTKLTGRASVKSRHSLSSLAVIQEVAE